MDRTRAWGSISLRRVRKPQCSASLVSWFSEKVNLQIMLNGTNIGRGRLGRPVRLVLVTLTSLVERDEPQVIGRPL